MESSPSPRVLLVDGDEADRRAALDLLRHLGLSADQAETGDAAVRRCTSATYDVVLTDLRLPAMDGVEVLRALRTLLPADRRPRVVAVTGHASEGMREAMLAAGFDGFYAKPMSAEVIREAVGLPHPAAFVARPPVPAGEVDLTAQTLYEKVCAHVTDMLGEEDPEFVAELVESFSSSSREAVADAQATRLAGDMDGLAAAAHRLKGSASNVGLDAIAERWGAVEDAVRGGGEPSADTLDGAFAETSQAVDLLEARV